MGDNYVKNMLAQWDLELLTDKFESEGIDEESFQDLDANTIKELIPKIGVRLKFEKQFKLLKRVAGEGRESSATDTTDTVSIGSSSENSDAREIQGDTNLELEQHLQNTVVGKQILKVYSTTQALDYSLRTKLADVIIQAELKRSPSQRISTQRFEYLSKQIVALFPTEDESIYFVPYIKTNGVVCNAKGKLWSKYCNTRRALRRAGVIESNVSSQSIDEASSSSNSEASHVPSPEEVERLQWLKNSLEPWTQVVEYWAVTTTARSVELKTLDSIDRYFHSYPVLKHRLGYTLLEIDFRANFANEEGNLFANWPEYCQRIIQYAEKSKNNAFVKHYMDVLVVNDSNDIRTNVALRILPLLFPIITVQGRKKGSWRPSKIEVQDGFITHIKNVADLMPTIERRTEKMRKFGLKVQPWVIIVGSSLQLIEASYVIIDKVTYKLETPLKALDICFKAIQVLCAIYSPESEQVWLFIQKAIYQITTKWDKKPKDSVGLRTLLNDLTRKTRV